MCGRYVLAQVGILPEGFGFVDFHDTRLPPPRFNIAPSQDVLTIVNGPHGPELCQMRWGFQPVWMRDPKVPPPVNARAETLLEKKMFREALRRGRCLIPADGFYEWAAVPGQRRKQPTHIRLTDGRPFSFAGLWTPAPDGRDTCTIVTTTANEVLTPIHHRMPVILTPQAERTWLDETADEATLLTCLRPYPDEQLEHFPVGLEVSHARADGPELIRPATSIVEQPGLPM